MLGELLEQGQEDSFVLMEGEALAKLLSNSEENFVILLLAQGLKLIIKVRLCCKILKLLTLEVGQQLAGGGLHANTENDGLETVDSVDLEMNLLSLHLLLQEGEGVNLLNHYLLIGNAVRLNLNYLLSFFSGLFFY